MGHENTTNGNTAPRLPGAIPLPSTLPTVDAVRHVVDPPGGNRPVHALDHTLPPQYEAYADPQRSPLGPEFAQAVQIEHTQNVIDARRQGMAATFAAEFLVDRSPIGAYLRTFGAFDHEGNRRSGCRVSAQASDYMSQVHVQREIEIAEQLHRESCKADAQRVLDELILQAFSDPIGAFTWDGNDRVSALPIHKLPAHLRRSILDYKVRTDRISGEQIHSYKFAPRQEMFLALCEHLGINNTSDDLEKTAQALMGELQRFQSTLNRPLDEPTT